MMFSADNSFFHENLKNLKVLVLVPHQDDEINTSGSLIKNLSDNGADITVAYTTNGDWKYPAETRIREAVRASGVLGVPKDNIVFLGYGDSINNDRRSHIFYHENDIAVSDAGHTETYGAGGCQDYAFMKTGRHHEYTAENYLKDIISIIEEVRPDIIVCTDFDEHPDHRILSLFVDKAVGTIRHKDDSYRPVLLKSFAYACSYTAVDDFCAINNPETQRPEVGETGKYESDLIDTSCYSWASRLRIPVPSEARRPSYKDNIIAEALRQHHSQYIITRAGRVINSDEVFFIRRTDNQAFSASIDTSSGDGRCLSDFLLYDTKDVDAVIPVLSGACWRPEKDDSLKTAVFNWDNEIRLRKIVIYGAISDNSGIAELEAALSDGSVYTVRDIPSNGNPVVLDLGGIHSIRSCAIRIISSYGEEYGISECEFFEEDQMRGGLPGFCKILIHDNFAYDYLIGESISDIPVGKYSFGDNGSLTLSVKEGRSQIRDGILYVDNRDKEIVLRLANEQETVWDQTVIRRLSEDELKKFRLIDSVNSNYIRKQEKAYKVHNMLYILRHQGPVSVIKRTFENVIAPRIRRK